MGGIDHICVGLFQDFIVLQWPLIKSLHKYHIVLFKVLLKLLFLKIRKCKSSNFVVFTIVLAFLYGYLNQHVNFYKKAFAILIEIVSNS